MSTGSPYYLVIGMPVAVHWAGSYNLAHGPSMQAPLSRSEFRTCSWRAVTYCLLALLVAGFFVPHQHVNDSHAMPQHCAVCHAQRDMAGSELPPPAAAFAEALIQPVTPPLVICTAVPVSRVLHLRAPPAA